MRSSSGTGSDRGSARKRSRTAKAIRADSIWRCISRSAARRAQFLEECRARGATARPVKEAAAGREPMSRRRRAPIGRAPRLAARSRSRRIRISSGARRSLSWMARSSTRGRRPPRVRRAQSRAAIGPGRTPPRPLRPKAAACGPAPRAGRSRRPERPPSVRRKSAARPGSAARGLALAPQHAGQPPRDGEPFLGQGERRLEELPPGESAPAVPGLVPGGDTAGHGHGERTPRRDLAMSRRRRSAVSARRGGAAAVDGRDRRRPTGPR